MQTVIVTLSPRCPVAEICEIVGETEKAFKLRNVDNGATCFAPKSALKPRKPGVPTYENEFVLAGWFRANLNRFQERVFGVAE